MEQPQRIQMARSDLQVLDNEIQEARRRDFDTVTSERTGPWPNYGPADRVRRYPRTG